MGNNDSFMQFIQTLTDYITGGTGKAVLIVVIMLAGFGLMFNRCSKVTAFCIIGGAFLVFSASYIASHFLGAS